MQPLRTYDYLELSRRRIFDWVRPLSADDYARAFPIGLGTLGRTLTHIMISEWFYVQRLRELEVPPYAQWPIQDERPPAFDVLERTWNDQARATRETLAAVGDWGRQIGYKGGSDERPVLITASLGDIFTQLAFHEVHHRAQAMSMLRRLGVAAEDIDYNALMYTRRDVVAGSPAPR